MPKTQKTLAEKWRTDERTIRRWKKAKAPLNDDEAMRSWLASRSKIPAGTAALLSERAKTSRAAVLSAAESSTLTKGPGAALRRLESQEVIAFERLQGAMKSGDETEIKNAREGWLRISESLRKFGLSVDQAQRDAAELVPRAVVQKAIRAFLVALRWAHGGFESCSPLLVGINDAREVYSIIAETSRTFMPAAASAVARVSDVPDWLSETLREGASEFPTDADFAKALSEVMRQAIQTYGHEARKNFDARVAAENRYKSATTPEEREKSWIALQAMIMPQLNSPATPTASVLGSPTAELTT